jgi:hypothetical protein
MWPSESQRLTLLVPKLLLGHLFSSKLGFLSALRPGEMARELAGPAQRRRVLKS